MYTLALTNFQIGFFIPYHFWGSPQTVGLITFEKNWKLFPAYVFQWKFKISLRMHKKILKAKLALWPFPKCPIGVYFFRWTSTFVLWDFFTVWRFCITLIVLNGFYSIDYFLLFCMTIDSLFLKRNIILRHSIGRGLPWTTSDVELDKMIIIVLGCCQPWLTYFWYSILTTHETNILLY